jgi:hypothetical protein
VVSDWVPQIIGASLHQCYQAQPYNWSHANLSELESFLRDRIEDGSFKPTFPFEAEFPGKKP